MSVTGLNLAALAGISWANQITVNTVNACAAMYPTNYQTMMYGLTGTSCNSYSQTVIWPTAGTAISNYQTIYWPMQTSGTISVMSANAAPETKAERVARKLRERKMHREERARRVRATEALVSTLTEEQRKQFEDKQHFELQVNNKLYRIRPGARVERIDPATKKVLSYFCIHPDFEHGLPGEDVALSQKLLLEAAESEFLRIANETKAA